ncbi:MAG TPA: hypothetical protein VLJ38_04320 [Polyangiaceae bacterium]|nr:hypothetical protein [Polyangiaceae bacterium]
MVPTVAAIRPGFERLLLGGLVAGAISACANNVYFMVYRWATGFYGHEPSFTSITLSSLAPSAPAALGYFVLARLTARARVVFASLTAIIIVISFEGLLRQTLPDGAPKPAGFDGAVMPMHVVVGLATALLVPWFARRRVPTGPRETA